VLDGAGRHPQRLAAHSRLDRLEVPARDRVGAYERFDLRDDFGREGRLEPPFGAASDEAASGASSWASAQRSQASQKASTWRRNCWPAAICCRTRAVCAAGTKRDCVRPPTVRVRL